MKKGMVDILSEIVKNNQWIHKLTNDELVTQILRDVWSQFPIASKESALLDVAIERLKNKKEAKL